MISVVDKTKCTGCYACVAKCSQACIVMQCDAEGFWYPCVDHDRCICCGICVEVCPTMRPQGGERSEMPTPVAYAAYSMDEQNRLASSSGGVFTIIAEKVLEEGGVVFGARFDDDFNVIHDYAEHIADVGRFRGSKYVQSKIAASYTQVRAFLRQDRMVLFSGTPCQVSGLKHYLGKEYSNLICQDIICHGVPSPKVWRKYLSFREKSVGAQAYDVSFRRKDKGWKRFAISISFSSGLEYLRMHHDDLYMQAFLKNISLRPSCHACQFKTVTRDSDITLGDFWGAGNVVPDMDDDRGLSVVIAHSRKGQEVLKQIRGRVTMQEVSVEQCRRYNSALCASVERHPARDEFFERLEHEEIHRLIGRLCKDGIGDRLKRLVRQVLVNLGLLETVKRIVGGRRCKAAP
jgi:coenzyme F420-reducing hydrogenase beta subunit